MDIVHPSIRDYLQRTLPPSSPPLGEMEERAMRINFPIIGPMVGRILEQLVVVTRARKIFELGSGYGYSALWMALALPPDGVVICTDRSSENKQLAEDYFRTAGVEARLDFRVGDALEILAEEPGQFDLILNDMDKERYPLTIKPVKEHLRPGGVFVADNLLMAGRVLESSPEESTLGVLKFTEELYNDPDFVTSIIPIRDGVSISVRK